MWLHVMIDDDDGVLTQRSVCVIHHHPRAAFNLFRQSKNV